MIRSLHRTVFSVPKRTFCTRQSQQNENDKKNQQEKEKNEQEQKENKSEDWIFDDLTKKTSLLGAAVGTTLGFCEGTTYHNKYSKEKLDIMSIGAPVAAFGLMGAIFPRFTVVIFSIRTLINYRFI